MNTNALVTPSPISAKYWSELKDLSDNVKLELITLLSSSMTHPEEPAAKPRKGWASRFAGVWKDSRSAEELMNGYLLDTSTCIFLLRGKHSVEDRLNEIDESKCYISDIVVAELVFGAYYSDQIEENLRQVEEFVSEMKIVTFDETLHIFAQERAKLWKAGKKIEDFDLLIGCAAKAKDLTIVTHNRKHFEHIEGLRIEDWAV